MAKSIKENFVYNAIGTVSSLLFPLITFPYVTRVLQAEGIGQVAFYSSIISYITLFTGLGIPTYAIREIAKVRDDRHELSKTTIEIISLNLIMNVIGYVAVAAIALTVSRVQENIPLFLILSSSMVLTSIGCPWFYDGVEDFKYITIRGIVIKIIAIVFLFAVVKNKDDILWYGIYTVIGTIGNYVLNFLRLRKYISFDGLALKLINPFKHIKPAFSVFVLALVTSVYVNLDRLMLGFLADNEAVGYYTSASNLSHLLLTLVTSLSVVLLPRSSNLLAKGEKEAFYALSYKAYNFMLMLSFPVCFGLIIMSPTLIHLFCGSTFEPAVITLRILAPIVVAIGISNLIGIQMLYPLGKIKVVTLSCVVGACVNALLNICLIPAFKQDGAAIATIVAEISVTLTQLIIVRKLIPVSFINGNFFRYFVTAGIMFGICWAMLQLHLSDLFNVIVIPIAGAIIYGGLLLLQRNELAIEILQTVKLKFPIKP